MINIRAILEAFAPRAHSPTWAPEPPEHAEPIAEALGPRPTIVDLEAAAAKSRYRTSGKIKRTKFKPVDLRKRVVIIVLHQAGAKRGESTTAKRGPEYTCHRLIGPTGVRYRVHPIDCVLEAADAFNYRPFHALDIEFGGNFAGIAGDPRTFWRPDVLGRSVLTPAQAKAGLDEITQLISEVEAEGAIVRGIAPHRVSGNDKHGKPNRPICCGSEIWSIVGERAAMQHGLLVPGPDQTWGGLRIHDAWHGVYYGSLVSAGLVGWPWR